MWLGSVAGGPCYLSESVGPTGSGIASFSALTCEHRQQASPRHSRFPVSSCLHQTHKSLNNGKMVLLTVTPSILEALKILNNEAGSQPTLLSHGDEPSLDDAAIGNPISHSQIVDIWTTLKNAGHDGYTLEMLLKGSRVYVPPPPRKPEPVSRTVLPDDETIAPQSPVLISNSRMNTKLSWPASVGNKSRESMSA